MMITLRRSLKRKFGVLRADPDWERRFQPPTESTWSYRYFDVPALTSEVTLRRSLKRKFGVM